MYFTDYDEHSIDSKQRLAIPAGMRSVLRPEIHGEAFYLSPGANGALWIWPEKTFEAMASKMEGTFTPGREIMEFQQLLFPQSRRTEMDKTGRIRIPEKMLHQFGLGNTVVIAGVKDHMEIHDPAQWEKLQKEQQPKTVDIMMSARESMERSSRNPHPPGS